MIAKVEVGQNELFPPRNGDPRSHSGLRYGPSRTGRYGSAGLSWA